MTHGIGPTVYRNTKNTWGKEDMKWLKVTTSGNGKQLITFDQKNTCVTEYGMLRRNGIAVIWLGEMLIWGSNHNCRYAIQTYKLRSTEKSPETFLEDQGWAGGAYAAWCNELGYASGVRFSIPSICMYGVRSPYFDLRWLSSQLKASSLTSKVLAQICMFVCRRESSLLVQVFGSASRQQRM